VSLTRTEEGICLVQKPIAEVAALRCKSMSWQNITISKDNNLLKNIQGRNFEIISNFQINNGSELFGFRVRVRNGEETVIAYNALTQKIFINRTHSGQNNFHSEFAGIHSADLVPINGSINIHIFVDSYSVEVFANNGQVTLTDCIFPAQRSLGIELFSENGDTQLNQMDFYQLAKPNQFNCLSDVSRKNFGTLLNL
jgi:fructan beta-fructosidase